MGIGNQGSGPNFVPSYQMSGVPFVRSSNGNDLSNIPLKISFPFVTRFIHVSNTSEYPLRVGFSEHGVAGTVTKNYLVLSGSTANSMGQTTERLEIRCKEVWLRRDGATNAGFSLIAGLTQIEWDQFPVLTGSNGFKGIG